MGKGICAAVVAAVLLGAAPAQAKTWYVSPSGTGDTCTAEAPCPIRYGAADQQVQDGDEVVFRPGTYELGDEPISLIGRANVIVRGDGAGSVVIRGNAPQNTSLMVVYDASQVRDLRLVQTSTDSSALGLGVGADTADATRAVVERVIVESVGYDAMQLSHDTLVRDSIAIATNEVAGATAVASVSGAGVSLRNVTALGAMFGVSTFGDGSALGMRNSIARSTHADGYDLDNSGHSLAVAYSSYRSERTSGTITQVGTVHYTDVDPLVDPATGRTAIGSPMRDAGDPAATDLGSADVFGRPRALGARIDVGAVELYPPAAVTTAAASAVGKDRATLGGTVDPGGAPVSVTLEVAGRTIDLGTTSVAKTFAHEVTGLLPSTAYSARLVATHEEGRFEGATVAFTTAAPDPPAPPIPPVVTLPPVDALASATLARTAFGRRRSTSLSIVMARTASVKLTLRRRVAGRRRAGRCVAPRRARRGRRCVRELTVRRQTITLPAGTSARRLRPRARRNRLLPPGRYVVIVESEGKRIRLPFRLRR